MQLEFLEEIRFNAHNYYIIAIFRGAILRRAGSCMFLLPVDYVIANIIIIIAAI